MMVNPFLVICSLYYSILSSRNSYQFCIISTSFAFFQRSGSSLIIFGRSTGFQPPGSSREFCSFLTISQISIKNTRKINRIFLRLIVFYAYFALIMKIVCPARTTADDHFSAYLVPLPRPSIFTMPFSAIFFNSCVVFDLLNVTCGAMSPMDFIMVLLRM